MKSSKEPFKNIWLLLIIGVGLIVVAVIASLPHGQQIIPITMPGWRIAVAVSGSILFISSLIILLVGSVPDKELLTIDINPLNGASTKVLKYQYAYLTTVHDLLSSIRYEINPHLSDYTYGQDWILRNVSSGHILREMGSQWAKLNLDQQRDNRTLREVGIEPGMRLEVILAPRSWSA